MNIPTAEDQALNRAQERKLRTLEHALNNISNSIHSIAELRRDVMSENIDLRERINSLQSDVRHCEIRIGKSKEYVDTEVAPGPSEAAHSGESSVKDAEVKAEERRQPAKEGNSNRKVMEEVGEKQNEDNAEGQCVMTILPMLVQGRMYLKPTNETEE